MTRLALSFGQLIEDLAPLLPLIFAALFCRGLPWILGVIANG